ncbi:DUF898 domain-containing protein [Endozoicomonas sp. OPT23]|uniref:YjgN family protein n=1 Tax=Endozoicomonas sp. OPT23 TaxID=2072845 RepID=UPI00129AAFBC|nr:YjgN family protein [Endozoicomonas sp. OPT23]MRI34941.1 DUF898 domain-containing protein [Endozoicomonas sp. OPT23]
MNTGLMSGTDQPVSHDFEFSGKAGEFFRIWIVNVLLTIVTLGIYSAWAKVRTRQYFYGSTRVAGSSFSYLASPLAILQGRLIGIALLAAYTLISQYNPIAGAALSLLAIPVVPWIVARGLAFNARMSAWRNVRFQFDGSYGGVFVHFILLPMLIMLSLGFALPWVVKKQKEFLVSHYSFGGKRFEPEFTTGDFYKIYLKALGLMIIAGIVAGAVSGFLPNPLFSAPLMIIAYLLAGTYVMTCTSNLIYNQSLLASYGFESNLKTGRMLFLYITNLMAVLCSLGLATPWVMIRMARYKAECLTMHADESLSQFTDQAQREQSSIAEEVGDVFDVAVGI